MPPELSDDHVVAICRVLNDHEVDFVIIGGMAARLHDTGHTTIDVDICPSLDDANLSNLADALRELGARLRVEGDPAGVAFDPHPAMLCDVEMLNLITEEGSARSVLRPGRVSQRLLQPLRARFGRRGQRRRCANSVTQGRRYLQTRRRPPQRRRCPPTA